MVDSKPLLQTDRPPAYHSVPGTYDYSPQQYNYGAIPATAAATPGFQQSPPPYHYHDGQGKYGGRYHFLTTTQWRKGFYLFWHDDVDC